MHHEKKNIHPIDSDIPQIFKIYSQMYIFEKLLTDIFQKAIIIIIISREICSMIYKDCLIRCYLEKYKDKYENFSERLEIARIDMLRDIEMLPGFPDINHIIELSGHMYEKKECKAHMAFLPESYKDSVILELKYNTPFKFDEENLRGIRKLLESVDNKHCVVFKYENNTFSAIGTTNISNIENEFIPLIQIKGHLTFEASIRNYPLFVYKNGTFWPLEEFDYEELKEHIGETFNNFNENAKEKLTKNLKTAIENLQNCGHGTCLVIHDACDYQMIIERFNFEISEQGIELSNPFSISDRNKLLQVTKIDGGLLVDSNGNCRVIGCIFDGKITNDFEGTRARGSRYNSNIISPKNI